MVACYLNRYVGIPESRQRARFTHAHCDCVHQTGIKADARNMLRKRLQQLVTRRGHYVNDPAAEPSIVNRRSQIVSRACPREVQLERYIYQQRLPQPSLPAVYADHADDRQVRYCDVVRCHDVRITLGGDAYSRHPLADILLESPST